MVSVKFKNVNFNIKKEQILKNINLNFEPGKIYGLLGRNGAGKTTLLSLIATYQKVASGELTVAGENPYENERVLPLVNFFHQSNYNDDTDSIKAFFELRQLYYPDFNMSYAEDLLAEYKLSRDKKMSALSQGQSSVVEAIMGLATMAPVVLFDEVTNGMDAPSREKFYKQVLNAKDRENRVIVLSTHMVSEMDYLFDEITIIHHGEVLVNETVDTFLESGYEATGHIEAIKQFSADKNVLHSRTLGTTRAVSILGQITEDEMQQMDELDISFSPIKLQDLFINMTEDK